MPAHIAYSPTRCSPTFLAPHPPTPQDLTLLHFRKTGNKFATALLGLRLPGGELEEFQEAVSELERDSEVRRALWGVPGRAGRGAEQEGGGGGIALRRGGCLYRTCCVHKLSPSVQVDAGGWDASGMPLTCGCPTNHWLATNHCAAALLPPAVCLCGAGGTGAGGVRHVHLKTSVAPECPTSAPRMQHALALRGAIMPRPWRHTQYSVHLGLVHTRTCQN